MQAVPDVCRLAELHVATPVYVPHRPSPCVGRDSYQQIELLAGRVIEQSTLRYMTRPTTGASQSSVEPRRRSTTIAIWH
jgi:hypothetical protein